MKRIVFLAIIILFGSCSDKGAVDRPVNLVLKEKMVEIIKDMAKLEAHIKINYPSVAQFHKVMIKSGDSLLSTHKVSAEDFDRSMDYYGMDQKEMKDIYSEALDKLNQELGALQSEK